MSCSDGPDPATPPLKAELESNQKDTNDMKNVDDEALKIIRQDLDQREETIRRLVYAALEELPAADTSEHVVATYFIAAKSRSLAQVGEELSYITTTSVKDPPANSLLAECTGRVIDTFGFDEARRTGLVRIAFALKMLRDDQGDLYSTDILHIAGGAGVFAFAKATDIKLVNLAMSDETLRLFPGPAHGAPGVRRVMNLDDDEVAFGTVVKPCTGITPQQQAEIIADAARNPNLVFIKEDENFLPRVAFAPLQDRLRCAVDVIEKTRDQRGKRGLIFTPSLTSPPHALLDNVKRAIDAGVNGIMFSEYYIGGAVRLVRGLTAALADPPAIFGHNGGVTCRTRQIYREVFDLLARLDGIDFRQTALLSTDRGLLRPFGTEWRKCEEVLSKPLAGHRPVMMARAGGLDQGNLIPNLVDIDAGGIGLANYMFLAGTAINSIKNKKGELELSLGAEAMRQAAEVYHEGVFTEISDTHVDDLRRHARVRGLEPLSIALAQRYGE